jgi:beta-glucanase (GH16 family)
MIRAFYRQWATISKKKTPALRPTGQTSGTWNKIFEDTFTSASLDTTKWASGSWWSGDGTGTIAPNGEKQVYRPSQISQTGGNLRLYAQPENSTYYDQPYIYKSGQVITGPTPYSDPPVPSARFSCTYGFMEARIKMPSGPGWWPAFWTLAADVSIDWPFGGEIDIVEMLGPQPGVVEQHIHYDTGAGHQGPGFAYDPATPSDFTQDFHVYAVDWTATYIRWYVDGVQTFEFTNAAAIPDIPHYLILGLACGGNWLDELAGGGPGSGNPTLGSTAEVLVDWVRVWQRA